MISPSVFSIFREFININHKIKIIHAARIVKSIDQAHIMEEEFNISLLCPIKLLN